MKRLAALVVGLLLALPAQADMYPDAANAKLPEARLNLNISPPTVQDYGGICDGTHRALSTVYPTLAAAQAVYPFVTALTQGLDWAAATKALVSVPRDLQVRGTCALQQPLMLPAATTIAGLDGTAGFKAVAGFAPTDVDGVLTIVDSNSDVTIRGLHIDAAGLAFAGIYNEGGGGKRTHIENNWITNPTDSGVYIRAARYVTITGNSIDTPGVHCVTLTTTAQDFIVSNNHCFDPGGAGIIFMQGIKGVINGNRILNPGLYGDGVTGYSKDNYDVVIGNNMITDAENHGIHVAGSRISVTGNIIDGYLAGGIFHGAANEAYAPGYNCVIANNIIRNGANTNALVVIGMHDSTISGNVVSDVMSAHAGVYIQDSDGNAVTGNVSKGGAGQGYWLTGGSHNLFSGNISRNNAGYGFRISQSVTTPATQSTYNTFIGNVSDGDGLQGFSEVDTSANNVFTSNRIINNATSPLIGHLVTSILNNNTPLYKSFNYDPASLAIGATDTSATAVPGAQLGDRVVVSANAATDMTISALVGAPDSVTIKIWNNTGGVRDMGLTGFNVWVYQR